MAHVSVAHIYIPFQFRGAYLARGSGDREPVVTTIVLSELWDFQKSDDVVLR